MGEATKECEVGLWDVTFWTDEKLIGMTRIVAKNRDLAILKARETVVPTDTENLHVTATKIG